MPGGGPGAAAQMLWCGSEHKRKSELENHDDLSEVQMEDAWEPWAKGLCQPLLSLATCGLVLAASFDLPAAGEIPGPRD